jgi:hypothetical protein
MELRMRSVSPESPGGSVSGWQPFDRQWRLILAGGLRGALQGGRSGFLAMGLVWLVRLLLAGASNPLSALLYAGLDGGLIGALAGAALGVALSREE